MVFYFTNNAVSPPINYTMGLDKYENEEMIKWGWPEDVWFHVDNLPSAHVYIRLKPGETIDDIPKQAIDDACQLVKANSTQGNKQNNVTVVYTMWSNLKKLPGFDPGQVTFHKENQVRKITVEKRSNEVINRLKKTMREDKPDLRALREERDAQEKRERQRLLKAEQEKAKEEEKQRKKEAEMKSYSGLMDPEKMTSNEEYAGFNEDDFM